MSGVSWKYDLKLVLPEHIHTIFVFSCASSAHDLFSFERCSGLVSNSAHVWDANVEVMTFITYTYSYDHNYINIFAFSMFGNISMSRVSVCARSSFLFFLVASELHIHAASLTSSLLHCNFFCSCDVCSSFKNDTCLCVARMSENVSHAEKVWFVSISIVYPQTLLFWNRYECFLQLQTVERLITLHRFCILLFVLVPLLLFSLSDLTFAIQLYILWLSNTFLFSPQVLLFECIVHSHNCRFPSTLLSYTKT